MSLHRILVVSLIFCCLLVFATTTTTAATISATTAKNTINTILTPELTALSDVSILFRSEKHDTVHETLSSVDIASFSTTTHGILLNESPTNGNQSLFYPFGKSLSLSFAIPLKSSLSLQSIQGGLDSEQNDGARENGKKMFIEQSENLSTFHFNLDIDDIYGSISTDPLKPSIFDLKTTQSLHSQGVIGGSGDSDGEMKQYHTHTVFKTSQHNPLFDAPDTIIISVTPNTGDFDFSGEGNGGNVDNDRLETQQEREGNDGNDVSTSTKKGKEAKEGKNAKMTPKNKHTKNPFLAQQFDPLSSTPFSPLQSTSYTIEGLILLGNGDLYRIESASSLLYSKQKDLREVIEERDSIENRIFSYIENTNFPTSENKIFPFVGNDSFSTKSSRSPLNFLSSISSFLDFSSTHNMENTVYNQEMFELESTLDVLGEKIDDLTTDILTLSSLQPDADYDLVIFRIDPSNSPLDHSNGHSCASNINPNFQMSGEDVLAKMDEVGRAFDQAPLSSDYFFKKQHQQQNSQSFQNSKNSKNSKNFPNSTNHQSNNSTSQTLTPQQSQNFSGLTFKRWENCHPRESSVTGFKMHAYVAFSYGLVASNSKKDVNIAKVSSRLSFLLSITNNLYLQQLGLYWQLGKITARTEGTDEEWNVHGNKAHGCDSANAERLLNLFNRQRYNQTTPIPPSTLFSINHLFFSCPKRSGPTIVGIQYVGGLCRTQIGSGWSRLDNNMMGWVTTAHELGHSLGALHPFGTDPKLIGAFGGIMDYNNQALPDDYEYDKGARRFLAFNEGVDKIIMCLGISRMFAYSGIVQDFVPDCYQSGRESLVGLGISEGDVNNIVEAKFNDIVESKMDVVVESKINAMVESKINAMVESKINAMVESKINAMVESKSILHRESKINANNINNPPSPLLPPSPFTPQQELPSPTCGNNFTEPYEECDVETTCCKACKLSPNATCDGSSPQCCDTNCQSVPLASKRCDYNDVPNSGVCILGTCSPIATTRDPQGLGKCADKTFFTYTNTNFGGCGYSVPESGCNPTKHILPAQYAPIGTSCQLNSNMQGICLPATPFNQGAKLSKCIDLTATSYVWVYEELQACQCPTVKESRGVFLCKNAASHTVSQSYCSNLPLPTPPSCNCGKYHRWRYDGFQEQCRDGGCGNGVQLRNSYCEEVVMGSDNIPIITPADANICTSLIGIPFNKRECEWEGEKCHTGQTCMWQGGFLPWNACKEVFDENDHFPPQGKDDDEGVPILFKVMIVIFFILMVVIIFIIIFYFCCLKGNFKLQCYCCCKRDLNDQGVDNTKLVNDGNNNNDDTSLNILSSADTTKSINGQTIVVLDDVSTDYQQLESSIYN